jgi:adenylate cyclase
VGERVSIIGQLVETEADRHFWAGRVEGDIADLFDLQDQIAEMVASVVCPSARKAEMDRARKKKPDNLAVYDLVTPALPHLWAHRTHENPEAIALLDRALEMDM